jgi:hypothetical protein
VAAVWGLLISAPAALGEVVTLQASKDNTLYQSANGSLSNGAGEYIFVGRTDVITSGAIRRALIAFNVAAAVPAGARITRADLILNMSRTTSLLKPMTVHRMLADWGEGTSNAAAQEGGGTQATTGDATWLHRFFNTILWQSPGAAGSFVSTPGTTVQIGGLGQYTLLSTPALVADVQAWLDTPASNFGWILIGDESTSATAKRFDSRNNLISTVRPRLVVEYTIGATGSGSVPDGGRVPGVPLTVSHAGGGLIRLDWGPSCMATDTDFAVYSGSMPNFTVFNPKFCSTGGLASATFTPAAGDEFYVIAPRNATREGSYGTDSAGAPRPPSASACLPQSIASCP